MIRGDRLKQLRNSYGYTIKELAELIGVGTAQVSRYESEVNDPTSEILVKLSGVFNVTMDYLVGLSDSPLPVTMNNLTVKEQKVINALRKSSNEAIKVIVNDE
jgi:repressor LexA